MTTREVALEAGVAVGTLYDYFPSKEALLSGYIRHRLDALLQHLDEAVVQANELDWATRIKRLIRLTCTPDDEHQPFFNHAVLLIEHQIAEPKHHRRLFDELSQKWREAFAACGDLPAPPFTGDYRCLGHHGVGRTALLRHRATSGGANRRMVVGSGNNDL
ncbi:TetR/AcrR family transcriptional regulator [Pseudomonas umsongensis]|nr:TetR/AcrR family transcriptional regulator [Pseudomonas umsongensis]